jgi:hypothetical protein
VNGLGDELSEVPVVVGTYILVTNAWPHVQSGLQVILYAPAVVGKFEE